MAVVQVTLRGPDDLRRLAEGHYDVADRRGNQVVMYTTAGERDALRAAGFEPALLPSPRPPAPTRRQAQGWTDYHSYSELSALLDQYTSNFPSLCRKISLGTSVLGRELWALKITDNPDAEEDEPEIRFIANMHGDEPVGRELLLRLMEHLLAGFTNGDARLAALVADAEIWLVPSMNPDGYANTSRYNAGGYDLNRSFPEGSGTNLGNVLYGPALDTAGWPREVGLVMQWTASRRFALAANFHGGAQVANYPYDSNESKISVVTPAPDNAVFTNLALTYSAHNTSMWNSSEFPRGIVNGAEWYVVDGGMQDWTYRYAGCPELTVELDDEKWPAGARLEELWAANRESLVSLLEEAQRGVRGLVTDARDGRPVSAAVRVAGLHHLVFTDPDAGDYHRLLRPGTYTLTFNATGYVPRTMTGVTVGIGAATRVDVALQPDGPLLAARVNFQPAGARCPIGFLADTGAVLGVRGNGFTYGWESNLAAQMVVRQAGASQDLRYDTLCFMQRQGAHSWALQVDNGFYRVQLTAGDPRNSRSLTNRIAVEGVPVIEGVLNATNGWLHGEATVEVRDGYLSVSNLPGAISNRLCCLEVSRRLTPVEAWRWAWFGTATNGGAAEDGADPDGDGAANLMEYALGTEPTNRASMGRLLGALGTTGGGTRLQVVFARMTNATDLAYAVQAAGTLVLPCAWSNIACWTGGPAWSGAAADLGLVSETASATGRQVTVTDPAPAAGSAARYLRLGVWRP